MAKSVAFFLVRSRLDYANSLLFGTTQKISIVFSASKTHLLESLPVTFSLVIPSTQSTDSFDVLQHLYWLPTDQCIEFKLATLMYNISRTESQDWPIINNFWQVNSCQPAYLRSLLNYHTPTRSLHSGNTNLLLVPCVRTTFASCGLALQPPQFGTHYPLASTVLPLHTFSVTWLKLSVSSRPTACLAAQSSASDSATVTMCTLNIENFISIWRQQHKTYNIKANRKNTKHNTNTQWK